MDAGARGVGFAHGKVLLFGEHAVVYGVPAIAFGLERGVRATATSGEARLTAPAWNLDARPGDGSRVGAALAALLDRLPADIQPAAVTLEVGIPAGSGLGSSAAMAVSTARALASLAGVPLDDETLFAVALASERVFHGDPSGLDHTVAIRGGLLRFVRGTPPTPLFCGTGLAFVVAQVEDGADTGAMVRGVRAQREQLGETATSLHAQVGVAVEHAARALRLGDSSTLGGLMNVNHGLLCAMGVSTAALDTACHAARAAGAIGAKLTGAGGGGCVIALVGECDDVEDATDRARPIVAALARPNRETFVTRIGAQP